MIITMALAAWKPPSLHGRAALAVVAAAERSPQPRARLGFRRQPQHLPCAWPGRAPALPVPLCPGRDATSSSVAAKLPGSKASEDYFPSPRLNSRAMPVKDFPRQLTRHHFVLK